MDTAVRDKQLLRSLQAHIRACRRCRVAGYSSHGQPICSGPATARIMVVGQAPSHADAQARYLWSGPAGRRLMAWLAWAGLPEPDLRRRHYLTAVTRCYPGRDASGHGDRRPSMQEIGLCRDYLDAELGLLAPRLLIPVGRLAIDTFGGRGRPLEDLVGRAVQVDSTWIVPLPHPSGASLWLNDPEHQRPLAQALGMVRELCRIYGLA